jgi:hypothetical protein
MQRLPFTEMLGRITDKPLEQTDLGKTVERLPALTPQGPWLAGGALRRTLAGQSLDSDYDFFFASQEQFDEFCKQVKERGGWQISKNEHNTTLKMPSVAPEPIGEDEFTPYLPEIEVQAITTRWYASLEDVLDSFDFTICQFGYDGETLVCGDYSLWDLGRKRLVPHRLTFAVASLRRLMKYARQGYTICSGGLADILNQVVTRPGIINAETQYID